MKTLLLFCMLTIVLGVFAEDVHRLETSIGLSYGMFRDSIVSSVPRSQFYWDLVLGYHSILERQSHHLRFVGRAGGLAAPYDPAFEQGEIGAVLELRYQGNVPVYRSNRATISLGGMAYGSLDIVIPSFLGYSWTGEFGLGPSFEVYAKTGPHSFDFLFSSPIIGAMNRPLFAVYNFELEELLETQGLIVPLISNPVFSSYHNLFRFDTELSYRYELTKRIDFLARYELGYRFIGLSAAAHQVRQAVHLGVDIRFKGKGD